MTIRQALLAVPLALGACAYPYTPPALPPVAQAPADAPVPPARATADVTILVSIDGFHPAYLERGVTPNLSRLAAEGVSGPMRPSFPSKTFPNHWTLVTGLVPDRHGIVGNSFEDARRPDETFTMASDDPFWWRAAEPIWVTAEKAGIRTATMFWPGANVAWGAVPAEAGTRRLTGGVRPSDWHQYAEALTGDQRVDAVIDWMRRPVATRPRFVTLYFDTVDTAGHAHGPDAAETTQAIAEVDRQIGRLAGELAALGLNANLVVTSDHGMAAVSSARTIALDALARPADMRVIEVGPYAALAAVPGRTAALERALLRSHPHMTCWRKAAIPARLRYGGNPRVAPYLCLAEIGWSIVRTAPDRAYAGGAHGYDNAAPEMAALFVANGPAFARGRQLAPFDNVAVAPLLRDLIGLPPGADLDGTDAPFRDVLVR